MRVIAGRFRSRPLHSLRGLDLRPTADRLRETLFNVLSAGKPAALNNTVWLDLCAGTGAVGIEALSREASQVYFVDSSSPAVKLIQRNLQSLGLTTGFEVLQEDVAAALTKLETRKVTADFVFLDPPYRMKGIYEQTLRFLSRPSSSLLKPGAVIIVEHDKRFDPGDDFAPLQRCRKLEQGDATLSFYRASR